MQTGFSVAMLMLVLLFFFSNSKSKINRWCAISGIMFFTGIAKQAIMYEIIPLLKSMYGIDGLSESFTPIHAVSTWVIHTLAMPALAVAGLYFCNLDKIFNKYMLLAKIALFIPAMIVTVFYAPANYPEYQLKSYHFWVVHTVYNYFFGMIMATVSILGIHLEKDKEMKMQKILIALVLLPPVYYWLVTIFIPRLLHIESLFNLWQDNIIVLVISIFAFIVLAFRKGFMGLQLASRNYKWNASVSLIGFINESAEYSNHFLKTQIINMNMSIYLIEKKYASSDNSGELSKHLGIISNSISYLEQYFDRIKHYSQPILLLNEDSYRVLDLVEEAMLVSLNSTAAIASSIDIEENVFILCDRIHIVEVFINIIKNAAEAISGNGLIEVTGKRHKKRYQLFFKDNGNGIDDNILKNIFTPLVSTKSKDKNSGLGLAYCKNVITKHGGKINAKSEPGKGTIMIVTFPPNRVKINAESFGKEAIK